MDKREYEFPLVHRSCPICKCEQTIGRLAAKSEFPLTGPPASLRQLHIPLEDPRKAILKVRTLVLCYDVCAGCGMEYCTWSDVQDIPIKAVTHGSFMPPR